MNSTLVLMIGYAVGQGSGFLLQIYCRSNGYLEDAGLLIIFYSLFSFAIQFSELGGATFIARKYRDDKLDEIKSFVVGRAIVAFLATSGVAFYFYKNSSNVVIIYSILIAAPILSLIYGLIPVSVLEVNKNYIYLSAMQAFMWIIAAGVCILIIFDKNSSNIYIGFLLSIAAILYFLFFKKLMQNNVIKIFSLVGKPSMAVMPFFLGSIGGQIWGRYILLSMEDIYGLSALSALGMVKYMQVATCLFLSFVMRPSFQNYLRLMDGQKLKKAKNLLILQKSAIVVSLAIAVVGIILSFYYKDRGYNSVVGPWLVLLVSIPAWVFSNIFSQINQINLEKNKLIFVEIICLSINILIFILFVENNPARAMVFGEIGQALMAISFYVYIVHGKNFFRRGL